MTIMKIIARAKRMGHIRGGLVICDNCDTPASKKWSQAISWTACAPCALGEADSFDSSDLIHVEETAVQP